MAWALGKLAAVVFVIVTVIVTLSIHRCRYRWDIFPAVWTFSGHEDRELSRRGDNHSTPVVLDLG